MGYTPPFRNSARVVSLVSEVSELVGQVKTFDDLNPNPTKRHGRGRSQHNAATHFRILKRRDMWE